MTLRSAPLQHCQPGVEHGLLHQKGTACRPGLSRPTQHGCESQLAQHDCCLRRQLQALQRDMHTPGWSLLDAIGSLGLCTVCCTKGFHPQLGKVLSLEVPKLVLHLQHSSTR